MDVRVYQPRHQKLALREPFHSGRWERIGLQNCRFLGSRPHLHNLPVGDLSKVHTLSAPKHPALLHVRTRTLLNKRNKLLYHDNIVMKDVELAVGGGVHLAGGGGEL